MQYCTLKEKLSADLIVQFAGATAGANFSGVVPAAVVAVGGTILEWVTKIRPKKELYRGGR
jgi:hypothetical protein